MGFAKYSDAAVKAMTENPQDRSTQAAKLYESFGGKMAAYTGCEFVKRGIAPKSVLFSRNARRFKRSDVDAWSAGRAPMPPRASLALCTDEQDHTLFAARP